ncbi:ABC-type sugar transport system permease subunit [Paenibacillus rhizosphaerae]|uniref:ABC-type sugar transport system permease subunit n=1 Tax=Paenibacillus rhizosphaerae TaxID=297318 RepID=A0A839TL91_9BACL|nr:sugar ABC transporter permease [Paenibacillus rhizosphaerae]MBB3126168.1 ABC-type sugar transport system permease subunit [Paenibacillus rhizosphaerae]
MSGWIRIKNVFTQRYEGILLILPWIVGFLLFVSFPLFYSLYMSFHSVRITGNGILTEFVGWKYYSNILFQDGGVFYDQLLPFLRQVLFMIPIIVIFSFMIAIMLNQKFFGRGLFRAVFFLPVIFSSGNVIQRFLSQGRGELGFLEKYSISTALTQYLPASWSMPIVTVLNSFILILWYSGVQILLFLAGRQTISSSVYEAARIDGANPWEVFWKITLPAMMPFVLLNTVYTVVDLFTFPGNPIIASVNPTQYGPTSALIWVYFIIILLFLGLVFLVLGRAARGTTFTR